ncbi:MAG: zinc-dependent metalloprotease [Bacteroidia bacterium]|nr:zinc-dependent metalloprotease [Bacteroidia bacterium]
MKEDIFWKKKKKKSESTTAPKDSIKKNSIEEKIKSCRAYKGLFTLYQDTINGTTYMLIKKEQLEKEYIYFCYVENGIVETGHFRGNFRDNKIFKLSRYFDRIEWKTQNTSFYFDKKNPLARSADANINEALLVSQKIIAEDTSNGRMLVDAAAFFLSENLHQIKPSINPTANRAQIFTLGTLNREKTKYYRIKSYPQNTDVVVKYVYDLPEPIVYGSPAVTDARSVSIMIQHSFIEVPQNNFVPRFEDPRVGFFTTEVTDQTTTAAIPYRDPIHRWHLEKRDSSAKISEPKEPIVFWIENTTPYEFRETIKEAVLAWNEAFEAAGFRNAIEVRVQPDTASWDAGDIRYNVIRWTSSPVPPFGGYGPSFVNPRTGQILGADIMLEFVYITNRLKAQKFFERAAMDEEYEEANFYQSPYHCSLGRRHHQSILLGHYYLEAFGEELNIDRNEFIRQALKELVLHEVGHTLGLMHNMKASNLYSPAEINNKFVTQATGLISSVMDYAVVNISPDPSKQGDFFTIRPGPYDKWAIEYGYSTAHPDPNEEKKRLERILARSTEPPLMFGNDADDMRFPGSGIDPRCMVDDLTNDAITYSADRIKLCNQIIGRLKDKYSTNGKSYQELLNGYLIATGAIRQAASVISRFIGGVYVDRAFVGQAGATQPYRPVPYEEQRRAMRILNELIFGPQAFPAPRELYAYLQPQRRGYNFFGVNEDPKIHERILNIQRSVLAHLLHPNTLKRINDTRLYGNQYTLVEVLQDLTNSIFQGDLENPSTIRQNLQIEYVNQLLQIAGLKDEKSTHDNIAQALAYQNLLNIRKLIATPIARDEIQAHRNYILFLIDKAMEKD